MGMLWIKEYDMGVFLLCCLSVIKGTLFGRQGSDSTFQLSFKQVPVHWTVPPSSPLHKHSQNSSVQLHGEQHFLLMNHECTMFAITNRDASHYNWRCSCLCWLLFGCRGLGSGALNQIKRQTQDCYAIAGPHTDWPSISSTFGSKYCKVMPAILSGFTIHLPLIYGNAPWICTMEQDLVREWRSSHSINTSWFPGRSVLG